MITIKCNCGATEMTFKHMKETDFPKGWTTDCCMEAVAKAPQIEVTPDLTPEQEDVEEMAAIQGFNSEEPEESEAQPEASEAKPEDAKRKGRKPWKK